MKNCDNQRITQQINVNQMLKLQNNSCTKKYVVKQSNKFPNNNSPVVGRQKSFENFQKVNKSFNNQSTQQQRLGGILNVMNGSSQKNNQQQKYNIYNELIETVQISHQLRKNQSMIQIEAQSPTQIKNYSFHHSVKNKQNSNSISGDYLQIQKIKEKIKQLLQEGDQNFSQEQSFMTKFNQVLNQLVVVLFQESNISNSQIQLNLPSTSDTFQVVQIDNYFKKQIQTLQISCQLQQENKILENALLQEKKKCEALLQDNEQLQKNIIEQNKKIGQMKEQIQDLIGNKENVLELRNKIDTQELKYLVQGQFEAIQKLLQREQLMKLFLRRNINKYNKYRMFQQFISNAENLNQDEAEGNLNVELLPQENLRNQKKSIQKCEIDQLTDKIIQKYEKNYKQLEFCDSQLADDSRVNDSEESSFGYLGKEQATEVSCYFTQAYQFLQQPQINKGQQSTKDKLKINMLDIQLTQVDQSQEFLKQDQQQVNQKILPDDINDEGAIFKCYNQF